MLSRRPIPTKEQREAEREATRAVLLAGSRGLHRGIYAGTTAAAPKSEPYRSPALLEMARGRPCLLLVPGVCSRRTDTTVACHQNMGKGMATKQSDEKSVWGCVACHTWYDQGPAPREQKRAVFMASHSLQVFAWREVATDPAEPERFRRAARAALERLNATPIGESL